MDIRINSLILRYLGITNAFENRSLKAPTKAPRHSPGYAKALFSIAPGYALALVLAALSSASIAQPLIENQEADPLADIITPDIERRDIETARIDTENWEVGVYAGAMSIEDFGTSTVSGFRVAYHISEHFFTEGSYAATEAGETSFETLSGSTQILTDDQRNLTYYDLSFGYNLFQGEIFLGAKRAYNANFYLVAGAGNTDFADDAYFTYSMGLGSRFFIRDWFAIHGDLKARSFEHELLGEEKNIVNLEPNVGLTFFF